jgi:hypothetical protein
VSGVGIYGVSSRASASCDRLFLESSVRPARRRVRSECCSNGPGCTATRRDRGDVRALRPQQHGAGMTKGMRGDQFGLLRGPPGRSLPSRDLMRRRRRRGGRAVVPWRVGNGGSARFTTAYVHPGGQNVDVSPSGSRRTPMAFAWPDPRIRGTNERPVSGAEQAPFSSAVTASARRHTGLALPYLTPARSAAASIQHSERIAAGWDSRDRLAALRRAPSSERAAQMEVLQYAITVK